MIIFGKRIKKYWIKEKYMAYLDRFFKKIIVDDKEKIPKIGLCWIWSAGLTRGGYGQFKFYSGMVYSHRLSFRLFRGKIPEGLHVCHKCDNRRCVNPSHFFLGTNKDNMDDKIKKSRHSKGEKHSKIMKIHASRGDSHRSVTHPESLKWKENHSYRKNPEKILKGEDIGNSKLTEKDVIEIRRLYKTGKYSQYKLAQIFRVNQSHICSIVNLTKWRHIK
jgi:hypothetical protein